MKIYNRVLTDDEVKAMYAIADILGPIVLNSSPTNGASGFPAGDNLSVDFSEPLLASSINSNSNRAQARFRQFYDLSKQSDFRSKYEQVAL